MGAYAAPTVGSWVSNTDGSALSPLAPASSTGKLLLLVTAQRLATQSITSLAPDWAQLGAFTTRGSIEVWGRVGDDTAADDPSVDWSGIDDSAAVILAYGGDVYTTMGDIVAHSATSDASTANLPLPPFTPATIASCLLFAVGRRNKTLLSNDATTISHVALTMRTSLIMSGAAQAIGIADLQQTAAADFDGVDMTIDGTSETLSSNGIVLYLRSGSGTSSTVTPNPSGLSV